MVPVAAGPVDGDVFDYARHDDIGGETSLRLDRGLERIQTPVTASDRCSFGSNLQLPAPRAFVFDQAAETSPCHNPPQFGSFARPAGELRESNPDVGGS